MKMFLELITILLILSWLGGCISGAYLGDEALISGGSISFGLLILYSMMVGS